MSTFGGSEPKKVYSGECKRFSRYVPMRDGVEMAISVYLPAEIKPDTRLPVLFWSTRYWREWELVPPFSWFTTADSLNKLKKNFKPFLMSCGYALVFADERGTGASFGHWPYPWAPKIIEDMYDIVEWIVNQPWAAPKVGGLGVSYLGTTAEILPACGHPAVKASMPKFNHPDPYEDITMPGGLYNRHFMSDWSEADLSLDYGKLPKDYPRLSKLMVRGVKPVDGRNGRRRLKEAQLEHERNKSPHFLSHEFTYKDEINPEINKSLKDIGLYHYISKIKQNRIPIAGYASWYDAGTAHAAIRRWLTFSSAKLLYIGAWDHGGYHHASPFRDPETPVDPPPEKIWKEHIRFFDHCLKEESPQDFEKEIHYYVVGAEEWRKDATFPPQDMNTKQYYFGKNSELSEKKPIDGGEFRSFKVDRDATTGPLNRWWELHTLKQGTFVYPDLASQESKTVVYDSPVLENHVEIIGYPVVSLSISSTHEDGGFIVYLEDLFPNGKVIYITEGTFRAVHRAIGDISLSPYAHPPGVPFHDFSRENGAPLVPGEKTELTFMMQPIAARIDKGHRIRIALAGHDADTFKPIPKSGTPVIKIYQDSFVELPIRQKS